MSVVLICRSEKALLSVPARVLRDVTLVLSDDASVLMAAREAVPHARVEPLGAIPTFWDVSADVRELVGRVDRWLASLAPGLPGEILHWGVHVEGGMTTQRIQDSLLFICAADNLVSRHHPVRVHLAHEPGSEFEDRVLTIAFRARGIEVKSYAPTWTERLKYGVAACLRPYGVFLKRCARLLAGMLRGRSLRTRGDRPLAVFQLGGSDARHIDNVRHFMQELAAGGELTPVALTNGLAMRADRTRVRAQLEARGLSVVALESYVAICDLFVGLIQSGRAYVRSKVRSGPWRSLEYKGIPLTPMLGDSRRHFFCADVPFRIVFYRAFRRFVKRHEVAALKPWGGSELFEGRLAMRVARERHPGVVVFNYWLGLAVRGWPYHDSSDLYRPDLFLAKGEHDRELCVNELGMAANQVVVVGHLWSPSYGRQNESESLDPAAARTRLDLPLTYSRYVAVDVSGALLGFVLLREQVELVESILDVATVHPTTLFVLKPHPAYSIAELLPLIARSGLSNVTTLHPKVAARDFVLSCDVTVAKYSMLLLEAALFKRPTISALMDRDARFKVFDEMPHVVLGRAELVALLRRILESESEFAAWAADRLRVQEHHLARFVARNTGVAPAARAAEVLCQSIRKARSSPLAAVRELKTPAHVS